MSLIELKKYQFVDAYRTAPAKMGLAKLAIRLLNTARESLYGKAKFDAVIFGDDLLVGLSLALHLKRAGQTVLMAPDSLGRKHWPTPMWGFNQNLIASQFESDSAAMLAKYVPSFQGGASLLAAINTLLDECSSGGKVTLLIDGHLQSSKGIVKGGPDLIFFPLRFEYGHEPVMNPLWRMVKNRIPTLAFQRKEVEYISAARMYYTTATSEYVNPALGRKVGLAVEPELDRPQITRAECIRLAFTADTGNSR